MTVRVPRPGSKDDPRARPAVGVGDHRHGCCGRLEREGGTGTITVAPGFQSRAQPAKPSELEQVVVAGDDRVGTGRKRALENPVVGFVLAHDAHRLPWMNENREVAACRSRLSHPGRGPAELASQNTTDLIEDSRPTRPRASTSSAMPEKFNAEM